MRFERQLLKCIDGDNNFSIERVEKEAMLAAGTLPIRVPATVHVLHSYNPMQGTIGFIFYGSTDVLVAELSRVYMVTEVTC